MSDTKDFFDNLTALAKELESLRAERVHDLNQIGGLQEENARLKAEVERLRKVVKIADGAVDCVIQVHDYGFEKIDTEYVSWLKRSYYAAKEGKPSV